MGGANDIGVDVAANIGAKYVKNVRDYKEIAKILLEADTAFENKANEVFAKFDKDNIGYIDMIDLVTASEALGQSLSEQEMDDIMKEMDESLIGKIPIVELKQWFRKGRAKTNYGSRLAMLC